MSSLRRRLKNSRPPKGFEMIEEAIDDFDAQLREAVNEDHSDRRRAESTWKVHRLHWEKNRFIYDLMYVRKVMSRQLYDWLVKERIADGGLIAKWRKPGYEILCSLLAIQRNNHNFGGTSHCRVPMKARAARQRVAPDVQTGCICCASGDGKFGGPIWWNTPTDEGGGVAGAGGLPASAAPADASSNRAVWESRTEAAEAVGAAVGEDDGAAADDLTYDPDDLEEGPSAGPSARADAPGSGEGVARGGGGGSPVAATAAAAAAAASSPPPAPLLGKRSAPEAGSDDDLDDDVAARLEALKRVA